MRLHRHRAQASRRPGDEQTAAFGHMHELIRLCHAVNAVNGTQAASSSFMYSGVASSADWGMDTNCANAPMESNGMRPYTRSPAENRVTCVPVLSTTPTNSLPIVNGMRYGTMSFTSPHTIILSSGLTPANVTRTRTSSGPTVGSGMSHTRNGVP